MLSDVEPWQIAVGVVGGVAVLSVITAFIMSRIVQAPALGIGALKAAAGPVVVGRQPSFGPRYWRAQKFGGPQRVQASRADYVGHALRSQKPWYYQREPTTGGLPAPGSVRGLAPRPRTGPLSGVPVPLQKQFHGGLDLSPADPPGEVDPSFTSRQPVSITSIFVITVIDGSSVRLSVCHPL